MRFCRAFRHLGLNISVPSSEDCPTRKRLANKFPEDEKFLEDGKVFRQIDLQVIIIIQALQRCDEARKQSEILVNPGRRAVPNLHAN